VGDSESADQTVTILAAAIHRHGIMILAVSDGDNKPFFLFRSSIPINSNQFQSIPINSNQFQSIPITVMSTIASFDLFTEQNHDLVAVSLGVEVHVAPKVFIVEGLTDQYADIIARCPPWSDIENIKKRKIHRKYAGQCPSNSSICNRGDRDTIE